MEFAEDFQKQIEFLDKYTESEGCNICNLFEMIESKSHQIASELEEMNNNKMSTALHERKIELLMKHTFHISTLVGILEEKINNDFFFNLDNLIYSLKTNDFIKK